MYFNVVNARGVLGGRQMVVSNVEIDRADFGAFLVQGTHIATATVAIAGTAVSTVSAASLSPNQEVVRWTVTAADAAEDFTLLLTVTTNDGMELNYRIDYAIFEATVA
jgi:hypothetical protein